MSTMTFRKSPAFRFIALTVLTAFAGLLPATPSNAQVAIIMPPPGQMIHITNHFEPPQMVGLKINLKDPFSFDFIMDQGQTFMSDDVKKEEFNKIIKYFLVSLAMPNKDMWVNLSPYESKRIIPEVFAQTEMGRDLLAQDYILKQFTASLMYPENGLGKKFWDSVYKQAQARFGTTEINVNTFNKVWIIADHADVYQKDDTAFLVNSHLKVMLEQDYMAIEKNKEQFGNAPATVATDETRDAKTQMASQLVREIIIPAIEKEVNEGKSFAAVRQVYNAEIMATWFKKTLRESLLGQVFSNKGKIEGQRVSDPQAMEKIYHQYLRAYKKGVFNYIREDATPDGQTIPRKYFSGGAILPQNVVTMDLSSPAQQAMLSNFVSKAKNLLNKARFVLATTVFLTTAGVALAAPQHAGELMAPADRTSSGVGVYVPAVQPLTPGGTVAQQKPVTVTELPVTNNPPVFNVRTNTSLAHYFATNGFTRLQAGTYKTNTNGTSIGFVGDGFRLVTKDAVNITVGAGEESLVPIVWAGEGLGHVVVKGGEYAGVFTYEALYGYWFDSKTGKVVLCFKNTKTGEYIVRGVNHEGRAVKGIAMDILDLGTHVADLVGFNLKSKADKLQVQLDAARKDARETNVALAHEIVKSAALTDVAEQLSDEARLAKNASDAKIAALEDTAKKQDGRIKDLEQQKRDSDGAIQKQENDAKAAADVLRQKLTDENTRLKNENDALRAKATNNPPAAPASDQQIAANDEQIDTNNITLLDIGNFTNAALELQRQEQINKDIQDANTNAFLFHDKQVQDKTKALQDVNDEMDWWKIGAGAAFVGLGVFIVWLIAKRYGKRTPNVIADDQGKKKNELDAAVKDLQANAATPPASPNTDGVKKAEEQVAQGAKALLQAPPQNDAPEIAAEKAAVDLVAAKKAAGQPGVNAPVIVPGLSIADELVNLQNLNDRIDQLPRDIAAARAALETAEKAIAPDVIGITGVTGQDGIRIGYGPEGERLKIPIMDANGNTIGYESPKGQGNIENARKDVILKELLKRLHTAEQNVDTQNEKKRTLVNKIVINHIAQLRDANNKLQQIQEMVNKLKEASAAYNRGHQELSDLRSGNNASAEQIAAKEREVSDLLAAEHALESNNDAIKAIMSKDLQRADLRMWQHWLNDQLTLVASLKALEDQVADLSPTLKSVNDQLAQQKKAALVAKLALGKAKKVVEAAKLSPEAGGMQAGMVEVLVAAQAEKQAALDNATQRVAELERQRVVEQESLLAQVNAIQQASYTQVKPAAEVLPAVAPVAEAKPEVQPAVAPVAEAKPAPEVQPAAVDAWKEGIVERLNSEVQKLTQDTAGEGDIAPLVARAIVALGSVSPVTWEEVKDEDVKNFINEKLIPVRKLLGDRFDISMFFAASTNPNLRYVDGLTFRQLIDKLRANPAPAPAPVAPAAAPTPAHLTVFVNGIQDQLAKLDQTNDDVKIATEFTSGWLAGDLGFNNKFALEALMKVLGKLDVQFDANDFSSFHANAPATPGASEIAPLGITDQQLAAQSDAVRSQVAEIESQIQSRYMDRNKIVPQIKLVADKSGIDKEALRQRLEQVAAIDDEIAGLKEKIRALVPGLPAEAAQPTIILRQLDGTNEVVPPAVKVSRLARAKQFLSENWAKLKSAGVVSAVNLANSVSPAKPVVENDFAKTITPAADASAVDLASIKVGNRLLKELHTRFDLDNNKDAGEAFNLVFKNENLPRVVELLAKLGVNYTPEEYDLLAKGAKDKAQKVGGINLSDEHLTINIKVDGAGMPLPPQYQDRAMTNLGGLISVIRKIAPLTPENAPAMYSLVQ